MIRKIADKLTGINPFGKYVHKKHFVKIAETVMKPNSKYALNYFYAHKIFIRFRLNSTLHEPPVKS